MEKKQYLKVFLVILGLLTFLVAFVMAFLNNVPISLSTSGNTTSNAAPSLFIQDIESLGKKYPSNANPAGWVFAIIWPIIFTWNSIGAFYMTASLCLPTDKSPVKRDPALIPISFLVLWIINWGSVTGWLFAYDREIMGLGVFLLILVAWSGYAMLGISYKSYFQDILILEETSARMLWLVRILIHNGFAIYVTWITCAWKLNFATVITYVDSRGIDKIPADYATSLTPEDAGTVALSILLLEIIIWFILENFIFEQYCRYTVTIWPTFIFAFIGIFVKNYVFPYSRNQAITLAAIILVSIFCVVRFIRVIYKHKKRMRYA